MTVTAVRSVKTDLPEYFFEVLELVTGDCTKVCFMALCIITQVHAEVCHKCQRFRSIVPKKIQVLLETPPSSSQLFLKNFHDSEDTGIC